MRKNGAIYALILLCAAFTPSALNGVWWTVKAKQKEEAIDYAKNFGAHLRAQNTLFKSVPTSGSIKWHHVLDVKKDATPEEIRQARRKLVLATHTDKQEINDTANTELIKAVNAAVEESRLAREYYLEWSGQYVSRFGNFDRKGPGTVPSIDSIAELFMRGREPKKAEQVNPDTFPEEFRSLTARWKRFYIAKFAVLAGAMLIYHHLRRLSQTNKDSWFTRNKTVQRCIAWRDSFKKEHPNWSALLERGGFITFTVLYPLYRFRKIFTVAALTKRYPCETRRFDEIDKDNIKVFYRMVHTRTIVRYDANGRHTEYIHEPSPPICYMPAEQERKEFMQIRKAQAMSAIMVAISIAATWLGCAW